MKILNQSHTEDYKINVVALKSCTSPELVLSFTEIGKFWQATKTDDVKDEKLAR